MEAVTDITKGQRWWLEKLWAAFGNPLEEMSYGVGHRGSARMVLNGLVFVVDRERNTVSVEVGMSYRAPSDFKDLMIWRDEHGYDGSYEGTRESLADWGDHARKAAKENA